MSEPSAQDKAKLFGASQWYDKVDQYETSMVAAVMAQIGVPAAEIKQHQYELAEGFVWDWFNNEGYIRAYIGSTRIQRFNFFDILAKPATHPLTDEYVKFADANAGLGLPMCLIFRVATLGNWVATNLKTDDETCIHVVARGLAFNLVPFPAFFKNRWSIA